MMCDPRNHQGGYKKHRDWLQKAGTLLELLTINKNRTHSKTGKIFDAVTKRIDLMDKSITAESCKSV